MATRSSRVQHRSVPSLMLAIVAAGLALVLAGCSSTATNPQGQGSQTNTSNSGGPTVTLTIHNFAFAPTPLTVKKGTTIKVVNQDEVAHTVTSLDRHTFDTGDISGGGGTASFTANTIGTFAYHCLIHPFMHGVLTVTA